MYKNINNYQTLETIAHATRLYQAGMEDELKDLVATLYGGDEIEQYMSNISEVATVPISCV